MSKTRKNTKTSYLNEDPLQIQQSIARALLGIIAISIFMIFFLS